MGYNDEIKIFNGILKGDEKVLKDFYKKNFILIDRFIVKNSGKEEDSEDIFQDALITLYQKLQSDSFAITCSIHTYFYGICKNMWNKKLSRERKVSCCGKIEDIVLDIRATITDEIEQKEKEQLYRKHFANLTCKCKQIFTLYFEGKSVKEIAQITNHSEGNVRKKKFECKKYLIEMIEKDELFAELAFSGEVNKAIKKEVS